MANFTSADLNAYMAIGMQSAQGSPQVTPSKFRFVKYASGNQFTVESQTAFVREGGDGLDFGAAYQQSVKAAGQIQMNLRPEIAGQVFQVIPGGATWNGGSQPAIHTFHTLHASNPYFTLQAAHPGTDLVQLFQDARFTGFTLSGQYGQPWALTLPWIAMKPGASTNIALTPSYPTTDAFWVYHFSPSILIDGNADTTVESFSITQTLGIEELYAQSISPDDIVVQNRDTNVTWTRRYQNSTLWKKIAYGAGIVPTTSVPTGAFFAGVAYNGGGSVMEINAFLPLLAYDQDTITELDPDGKTVRETVTAKGLKGASGALILTVKNAHASAYAS